ncbi:MAG: hypothetical protein WCJ58_02650 [bacterium]
MKKILLDEQVVAAFFNKKNANFTSACELIEELVKFPDKKIYLNLLGILQIFEQTQFNYQKAVTKGLLDKNFNIESEIITKITKLLDILNAETIAPHAFDVLKRTEYIQKTQQLPFNKALNLELMQEYQIEILATMDQDYNKLFAENIIRKF